jgi:hypothetical protein
VSIDFDREAQQREAVTLNRIEAPQVEGGRKRDNNYFRVFITILL